MVEGGDGRGDPVGGWRPLGVEGEVRVGHLSVGRLHCGQLEGCPGGGGRGRGRGRRRGWGRGGD